VEENKMALEAKSNTIGTAGTAVKEGIVGSLKGLSDIETEIVNVVRNTVSGHVSTADT
jgi:hypothetical protein